jgi:hypothetical protein
MNYSSISDFGSNAYSPVNNPLTYCLNDNMDQRFLHGGQADTLGQHSKSCQLFMSEYCSDKWDSFCEVASRNTNVTYPNQAEECTNTGDIACRGMNAGEALVRNTAARKYLIKMHNAHKKYQPFDPTVATSPMISYWVSNNCSYANTGIPEYSVDPSKIDSDVVMDKILRKPIIAMNILINIYNTMKRHGTLSGLKGTKLGHFYSIHPYFKAKGGV